MGYDTVRLVEHLPDQPPDALACSRRRVRAADHHGRVRCGEGRDDRRHAGAAQARHRCADRLCARHRAPARRGAGARRAAAARHVAWRATHLALPEPVSNTAPAEFMAMVERAKEYIAAGDIFQVVLAQRFSVPFSLPPFALYRALRRTNPSPFLFHLDFGALRAGRLEPGDPGARARRRGDDPPARRHPAARRHARRGQGARSRAARRSQGARRAPDAARSRPQRRRPRRQDRHGARHRQLRHRALQPRHAHRLQRGGPARRASTTPSTR